MNVVKVVPDANGTGERYENSITPHNHEGKLYLVVDYADRRKFQEDCFASDGPQFYTVTVLVEIPSSRKIGFCSAKGGWVDSSGAALQKHEFIGEGNCDSLAVIDGVDIRLDISLSRARSAE